MGSRVPKSIELPSLLLLRSLTFLRILTRSDNVTLSELFLRSPSLIWTGCGRLWMWDLCFTIWRGEGGALLVRPLRGGAVVEPDGCVVAHGWQLQAAVLLFQAAEREVLALPLSSSVLFFSFSSFIVKWFLPLYSLFIFFSNSLLCFKLPHILSFLSLFCFLSFYSLHPLFLFCPPFVLALGGIYRAKGAGVSLLPPYCCA